MERLPTLINDIVWLKQKLMLGIAATNLMFTPEGKEAVSNVSEEIFGIPGLRMNGGKFLPHLEQVSKDTDSFDGLQIVQWKMALLDLHELLNETLTEFELQLLKNQEWYRALFHLEMGLDTIKDLSFPKRGMDN